MIVRSPMWVSNWKIWNIGLEYAYNSSPRSFQGIIMGLYAALEGVGSLLGIVLVQLMSSLHLDWIKNEEQFNEGHLDYFYYLLAVIQCLVVIILGTIMYTRYSCLVVYYCSTFFSDRNMEWMHQIERFLFVS